MAKRPTQPGLKPFHYSRHRGSGVYPFQNAIKKGYAVNTPNINPADKQANARMINQLGETIEFYVEEMEATFQMAGQTAQSRLLRQFFPHNMVQPSITVTGTAPNSHQYNRLAAFIRLAQNYALRGRGFRNLGKSFRSVLDAQGRVVMIPTIRLIIENGSAGFRKKVKGGRTIKGDHRPWKLEGYVKSMPAGATHFEFAPQYQFEFLIAESLQRGQNRNFGIWDDVAVAGDEIASWAEIFKGRNKKTFVGLGDSRSQTPNSPGENNIGNGGGIDFSQGPLGTGNGLTG